MSDITLPHPTFTDGNTLVADDVWQNLYDTPGTPNSFEVINGGLEAANLVSPTTNVITAGMIQEGSMSRGKGVGATANLDYFSEPFSDFDSTDATYDIDSYYEAIPGASIEFYLPYAPSVGLFLWQITTRTVFSTRLAGRIRVFLDGARIADSVYLDISQDITGLDVEGGRRWDSHYMKIGGLSKGWHSFSLRIAVDASDGESSLNQVRVHTRNINCVFFQ